MANILNCRTILSQIWKQQKAEPEAFGSRSLKVQIIDGFFESRKFEKVKGSNIVKCVQKKYFSYIIDKILSLRRNFSKALVILVQFLLLFLILFLLIVYIIILKFSKVSFFASLLHRYMKSWYFHGPYKANSLGTNEISYNVFDLRHMSKVAAHFQKKNKMLIFKQPNKESGKL